MTLLLQLARQAVRRHGSPPPHGHATWNDDAHRELVSEVYARKEQFVEKAIATTATDRDLELYLLTAFENVLRDQARETERGKLIERLKTILTPLPRFVRAVQPHNAWRLDTAPDDVWQGDIGHLIRAASSLRRLAVTAWNTSGKTPGRTLDAIVRVCDAALREANGKVADPDLAQVVQICVAAAPLEPSRMEHATDSDDLATFEAASPPDGLADPDEPTPDDVAEVIWRVMAHDERRAIPHLESARGVATALGLPRRTAAAVSESARAKIRDATAAEIQAAVLDALVERSHAYTAALEGESL
ncbi:hypothetical protein GCM10011519_32670 [Marmoricola endophyticus]|uniref:Uncharacterized protein n=1 Tax=Marmoricola endophyticus TaxID=2040280 RepID=A0A917BRF9_9ACTN|nr:hypothetical protein [Marmoricola endophyticus]GGF56195.1 hypothetical protein GCM10011519_32670 [Marmoricola endophyticus]